MVSSGRRRPKAERASGKKMLHAKICHEIPPKTQDQLWISGLRLCTLVTADPLPHWAFTFSDLSPSAAASTPIGPARAVQLELRSEPRT